MRIDDFTSYDLWNRRAAPGLAGLFPGWQPEAERVVILSPHDDDALLGAGYLIQAVQVSGGQVFILILCDGSAGYSTPAEKDSITARRKAEALRAYARLSLPAERILRFDYPDFSLNQYMGWQLPDGAPGTMQRLLPVLRRLRPTRLVLPNGSREHSDHAAAEWIARYDGPQVGDPILADHGSAPPVQGYLQYSVWGDFSPVEALAAGQTASLPPLGGFPPLGGLRASHALAAPAAAEEAVIAGLREFDSQAGIIAGLVAARQARRHDQRWLEVYRAIDPRPRLDYRPYHAAIDGIVTDG